MVNVVEKVDENRPVAIDPVHEVPLLADYRPFSRLAMLSVALGLLAWLALVSPLLWIVPIVALIVGIFAIRATTMGDPPPLGRNLAGLSLVSTFFVLGLAPAQYITDRTIICAHARKYADHWIDLVRRGELGAAHQLHLTYFTRVSPDQDLKEHYAPRFPEGGTRVRQHLGVKDPFGDLQQFFSAAPLEQMVSAGEKGKYEFQRVAILPDESTPDAMIVQVEYKFTYPDIIGPQTIPLQVKLKRIQISENNKVWNIEKVQDPKHPETPPAPAL